MTGTTKMHRFSSGVQMIDLCRYVCKEVRSGLVSSMLAQLAALPRGVRFNSYPGTYNLGSEHRMRLADGVTIGCKICARARHIMSVVNGGEIHPKACTGNSHGGVES